MLSMLLPPSSSLSLSLSLLITINVNVTNTAVNIISITIYIFTFEVSEKVLVLSSYEKGITRACLHCKKQSLLEVKLLIIIFVVHPNCLEDLQIWLNWDSFSRNGNRQNGDIFKWKIRKYE